MGKQTIPPDTIKISWVDWCFCFLAVFITFILLGKLAHYTEQMTLDENLYTNTKIITSLSWEHLKNFFTPVAANRHWTTMFSLAVNYACGANEDYSIYREWNLIFHMIGVFWFFWFSKFLFKESIPAFLIALTFGIATAHVESVASVAQRKDVLMGMLSGLALFLYVYGIRKQKETNPFYLLVIVVVFILAVQSKAMAVVFPVALVSINWYLKRDLFGKTTREKIFLAICFLVSCIDGIDAYYVQNRNIEYAYVQTFEGPVVWARAQYPLYGLSHYITQYFFPTSGSIFYLAPKSLGLFNVFVLIVVGMTIVKFWKIREIKLLTVFSIIYVILVLQILRVGLAVMADRYTYMFFIGISFFWVPVYRYWKETKGLWSIGIPLLCFIHFGILGTQTSHQVRLWEDNEKLLFASLKENPDNPIILVNLGAYYKSLSGRALLEGYPQLSIELGLKAANCFEKVISLGKADEKAFTNLAGILYYQKKDYIRAKQNCDSALAYNDTVAQALIVRGNIHSRFGAYELAEKDLERAKSLILEDTIQAEVYVSLGKVYMFQNKDSLAILMLEKSLEINGTNLGAVIDLAILYQYQNDSLNTLSYVQRANDLGRKIKISDIKELANLRKLASP